MATNSLARRHGWPAAKMPAQESYGDLPPVRAHLVHVLGEQLERACRILRAHFLRRLRGIGQKLHGILQRRLGAVHGAPQDEFAFPILGVDLPALRALLVQRSDDAGVIYRFLSFHRIGNRCYQCWVQREQPELPTDHPTGIRR
jgi:hypothetical protein